MTKITIFLLATFLTIPAQAKLLDKILAIVDEQTITLSQIQRVKENLNVRRQISPMIYNKGKFSTVELVNINIQRVLIREKLSTIGYIITDEQVEAQVKSTEKRLNLSRPALLQFLSDNNITYDEYFELTREIIEFNIFNSKVISPLISITEQEIKNQFYKENSKNKTLSFKYTLVDFSLPKDSFSGDMLRRYKDVLKQFQTGVVLPKRFSNVDTNVLGDILEDGLTSNLKKSLKNTNEGDFTNPILLGDFYHVFFVKNKDMTESSLFQEARKKIKAILFGKSATKVTHLWYQREENKHYIKYFLK